MRLPRNLRRQFNRLNPSRLVREAVRLGRTFATAYDHWLDDGRLLPPAAERAALWTLLFYFSACIVIWTAVYFQNHIEIAWVNR